MEIYKLKDNVEDGKKAFRITNLKSGVKNPNRVNVFVNDEYAFSLDVAQVVDYKLKVGLVISEEQLVEYKKASEFGKLYQRTLEWVLMRPRSERETRDYLFRKLRNTFRGSYATNEERDERVSPVTTSANERVREEYSELSDEILQRLISRGYIDDRKFAEFWVENRFVKKGVSRRRLEMELFKKGISREIIEEVLAGSVRNDETEIKKIIARKRGKYDEEKLINYLCRQGFSYQQVQSLVREYGKD